LLPAPPPPTPFPYTTLFRSLRWHLHELDPAGGPAPRTLNRLRSLDLLAKRLAGVEGIVARIARDLIERCRSLTIAITQLEREISDRKSTRLNSSHVSISYAV